MAVEEEAVGVADDVCCSDGQSRPLVLLRWRGRECCSGGIVSREDEATADDDGPASLAAS